jgi:hypothetical protein
LRRGFHDRTIKPIVCNYRQWSEICYLGLVLGLVVLYSVSLTAIAAFTLNDETIVGCRIVHAFRGATFIVWISANLGIAFLVLFTYIVAQIVLRLRQRQQGIVYSRNFSFPVSIIARLFWEET